MYPDSKKTKDWVVGGGGRVALTPRTSETPGRAGDPTTETRGSSPSGRSAAATASTASATGAPASDAAAANTANSPRTAS